MSVLYFFTLKMCFKNGCLYFFSMIPTLGYKFFFDQIDVIEHQNPKRNASKTLYLKEDH